MTPASSRVPWRTVNLALTGLVAVAVVVLLAITIGGTRVLPGTSPANRAEDDYQAATGAARAGMDAFLSVDYKNMDALQDRLLSLSTGDFKTQYAAARVNIKATSQAARAVATPTVRQVAISQLAHGKATAAVAADLVRSNITTKNEKATKSCPHAGATCLYFRFLVQLTRTADGWKLSGVEPVS